MIRKIAGIAFLSLVMVACSNAQEETTMKTEADTEVTLDTPETFKSRLSGEGAQLIDVRTPEEYAQGKIGDAQNFNVLEANFKSQLEKLDPEKPVLVYCASGGRSAKAVSLMTEMGFKEIHELKGGYNAWH